MLSQRGKLGGIAASLAVQSLSDITIIMMVRGFMNALFLDPTKATIALGAAFPHGIARAAEYLGLADVTIARTTLTVIVPLGLLCGGLLRAFATYIYQLNLQGLTLYVAKQYRERLFAALLALPYVDIRRRQVGEWMSVIMNDVLFLQSRFSDMITGLIKDLVSVVAVTAYLLFLHWPTGLALALIAPLIAFGMGRAGKRIALYAESFQREMARISAAVLDFRARFDFIRAQGGEARERERFGSLNFAYFKMISRSILLRSLFAPGLEFASVGMVAAIMYAAASGHFELKPDIAAQFFVAIGVLMKPLREIGEQLSRYHETQATLRNSLVLFSDLTSHKDASAAATSTAKALPVGQFTLDIARIQAGMDGTVRFEGEGLRLGPGQAVAVVGPSGAGKSTLLKTLGGLVEPLRWEANVAWDMATAQVSMVSQDPFLFDDTVAANLAYGSAAGAEPDAAAVWSALTAVNIDHEVRALPEELGTRLRAIGSNVSGGQLQRLVIARGLLRERPLWLFDEATSAIDARSERDITQRVIAACKANGNALLAVTHRLTWLASYDEVWFVEAGRVTMKGPHARLMDAPRYRAYCEGVAAAEEAAP